MKGGSFLSYIQTAFHQFCLIGPSVGAAGDGWDENATNGLKLMLASLTLQIYSTLERLSIFSFLFFLSISVSLPFSPLHLPPSLPISLSKGGALAIHLTIHLTLKLFCNPPISFALTSVMSNDLTAKPWKRIPFEYNGKSMPSWLHHSWVSTELGRDRTCQGKNGHWSYSIVRCVCVWLMVTMVMVMPNITEWGSQWMMN